MGGSKPRTKFEPVQLRAEPEWYVRITLPHGEDIHIDEFKTEAEARAWIDDKSAAWLKKYRGADTRKARGGFIDAVSKEGPSSGPTVP